MRFPIFPLALVCAVGLCLCQVPELHPQSRRLRADLDFLASDALAGRVSLSLQAEVAARYIASDFERTGLAGAAGGSYLQEFPLVAYRVDSKQRGMQLIRRGGLKAFNPGTDFTVSFARDLRISAPVVFVGYGISAPEYGYDDYAGIDAAGKIVLAFDHEPQEDDARSIFSMPARSLF